jgi:hypothetical protein
LEGGDYDFLNQLPEGGVARIRAIELIDSFSDLLPQLESAVADAEQWRAELHSQLAANPLSAPQLVD